jgi:RimJ/RimL family protein N-acetyltransferase
MTELVTRRLTLRAPRPEDAPRFALGISEFAVARWLSPMPWPFTLAMAQDYLRNAPDPRPEKAFFVIEHPDKGLIGCISMVSELGFWIARPHWNKGYCLEAAAAVIDWHFSGSGAELIRSRAHRDNLASLRVKSKLGFVATGKEMQFSQPLQYNVEHVTTALSRETWMKLRAQQ